MGAGVKYAGDVSLRSRPGPSGAGACFCRGRGGSGRYVAGAISFSAGRDRNRKGRKDPRFRTFRASTLAETLVMMLVAGIVFLTVMDGLTLFSRLQAQRMEALTAAGRRIDGYYRVVWLISRADSIRPGAPVQLELYCGGSRSELSLRDSALVFSCGDFRDTLLRGVGTLRLETCESVPCTLIGAAYGSSAGTIFGAASGSAPDAASGIAPDNAFGTVPGTASDSVTIVFAGGFAAKFPVRSAARKYDDALEKIEESHVYEE